MQHQHQHQGQRPERLVRRDPQRDDLVDQGSDGNPANDVNVSSIAFADSYNAVGNVTLSVDATNGLLGGATAIHETDHADVEFFSQAFGTGANDSKVMAGTFATEQGGSVTIACSPRSGRRGRGRLQ